MTLQRDAFIEVIHLAARKDRDIFFLSADFGAEALDAFRNELPNQFIHCGISEQHMIDMAAGLALAGKKVYVYAMGPFLSLRCYEQTKCLAMMSLPVTMISVGVGLGYADSGPTHYLTEDIACMRALNGIEILTPADAVAATEAARLSLNHQKFRYIRLDREPLPSIYSFEVFEDVLQDGFHQLEIGSEICILSSGYMLHRVIAARDKLLQDGINIGVIDLFRIKPINSNFLSVLDQYKAIVTVEEQCLSGGFGSAILEEMADNDMSKSVHRMGLPDRYFFENGGRSRLLDVFGLSVENICEVVKHEYLL